MKISLNWLQDYIHFDENPEQIAEILSDLGFPNEGIEYLEDDTVIDLEVTSNRGDCLSHIGVARELAAYWNRKLVLPTIDYTESKSDAQKLITVNIEAPDLCWRYTGMAIEGVKIGPTPDWMKKRLEAVGIRSVNNVVDATNYAMMETGQPPHAFDFDKITDGTIVVRKARNGETLVSIDETKCELNDEMLIIADSKTAVAIAGVMGGLATEISESTTTVLLEDARFDPLSIRATGRKLGISSEASFRFERQIDTEQVDWAARRTADLIVRVAGGSVAKGIVDTYPVKPEPKTVAMRLSRLNSLLGITIEKEQVLQIFKGLGFNPEMKNDDLVVCTEPTWRHDISREVDLIEEAARFHGYDKIPVDKKLNIEVVPVDKHEYLAGQVRSLLNGCGYFETINVTFTDSNTAALFEGADVLRLSVGDESRKSANLIRQTLLGSLANVYKNNRNVGNTPCSLYEIADTFIPVEGSKLPQEFTQIALMTDQDLRSLRGTIEAIIRLSDRHSSIDITPATLPWAQTAAQISIGDKKIGVFGVVSSQVLQSIDIDNTELCAAELNFETILHLQDETIKVKPIPKFPSITRDLSLIMDEPIQWQQIDAGVSAAAPQTLEAVDFVGIYRGKPIPSGRKSVTLSLRFRDEDGTLTHEQVDEFEKKIVTELTTTLKAELRTV